jgi:hypothetical protein
MGVCFGLRPAGARSGPAGPNHRRGYRSDASKNVAPCSNVRCAAPRTAGQIGCQAGARRLFIVSMDANPSPALSAPCIVERLGGATKPGSPVAAWNLESPADGGRLPAGGQVPVTGWAVVAKESSQGRLHVVIRLKSRTLSYPLEVQRRDVVEQVLKTEAEGHPCLVCGFSRTVSAAEAAPGFEVGFESDGTIHPAARVSWG